jgi:hypothetical protein
MTRANSATVEAAEFSWLAHAAATLKMGKKRKAFRP